MSASVTRELTLHHAYQLWGIYDDPPIVICVFLTVPLYYTTKNML